MKNYANSFMPCAEVSPTLTELHLNHLASVSAPSVFIYLRGELN